MLLHPEIVCTLGGEWVRNECAHTLENALVDRGTKVCK